jgi:hypothetical protein
MVARCELGVLDSLGASSRGSRLEKRFCEIADHPEAYEVKVVGTTGFEPATSRTPSVRATRLRYVPTVCDRS